MTEGFPGGHEQTSYQRKKHCIQLLASMRRHTAFQLEDMAAPWPIVSGQIANNKNERKGFFSCVSINLCSRRKMKIANTFYTSGVSIYIEIFPEPDAFLTIQNIFKRMLADVSMGRMKKTRSYGPVGFDYRGNPWCIALLKGKRIDTVKRGVITVYPPELFRRLGDKARGKFV